MQLIEREQMIRKNLPSHPHIVRFFDYAATPDAYELVEVSIAVVT